MTVSGPRVKDFTGDAGRFPVEIVSGPVFELLMSLFALSAMQDEGNELADFAVGDEWLDGVRAEASGELLEALDRLTGAGEVWITLTGVALTLASPGSIDALVGHLRAGDPVEHRLEYVLEGCMHCRTDISEDARRGAAGGDSVAIAGLAESDECHLSDALLRLLESEPAESMELLARTIELFDHDVFRGGAEVVPILERDADHKRAMARTLTAQQLVETATNGVTFQMQPEVDGIVLIPSVVVRPWVTIGSHERRRFFCYPVAEQHLTAEPDSPPAHLVDVYKALGDERRLRLMRILADGPMALAEVTERVGLAKSTVHHHLSILRQAGLVLVTVGADREYSLRRDAIPESADLLATFLAPTPEE